MKKRQVLFASAAALVAAIGLTGAYAGLGGDGHGWHHRGGHGLHDRVCGPDRAARLEAAIVYVRAAIDVRPEQDGAWFALVDAVREATGRFDTVCAEADGAPGRGSDAHLARAEAMLVAGLAALRDVRPALDAFTAVLDDGQRQRFDALAEHRRS